MSLFEGQPVSQCQEKAHGFVVIIRTHHNRRANQETRVDGWTTSVGVTGLDAKSRALVVSHARSWTRDNMQTCLTSRETFNII